MTQFNDDINGGIAPLSNVALLAGTIERLRDRRRGLPGMAAFYGPSGYGKSSACAFCALKYDAIYIEVASYWTKKQLMTELLRVLDIPPMKTIPEMAEQIAEALVRCARPVLIDEGDYLVNKNMIDDVRGLYERSGVPFVIIGEQRLPQLLKKWERVHSRMLVWAEAAPVSVADTKTLATLYAPDITIDDDLLAALHKAGDGSARRVVVNVDKIRTHAQAIGLDSMGVDEWSGQQFDTGLPLGHRGRAA